MFVTIHKCTPGTHNRRKFDDIKQRLLSATKNSVISCTSQTARLIPGNRQLLWKFDKKLQNLRGKTFPLFFLRQCSQKSQIPERITSMSLKRIFTHIKQKFRT